MKTGRCFGFRSWVAAGLLAFGSLACGGAECEADRDCSSRDECRGDGCICTNQTCQVRPPPPVPRAVWNFSDPCAAQVPQPTDLFFDARGRSEAEACPLPADPLQAALTPARRDQRAAPSANVVYTIEGGGIDASSLTRQPFALTGTASTDLPPAILLRRTGTGTAASDFEVIDVEARFASGQLTLTPAAPLAPGGRYIAILTHAIRGDDADDTPMAPSPAVEALVAGVPVQASAEQGWDGAAADRLERQRLLIAPVVALLAKAAPVIEAEAITSIHAFSVEDAAGRLDTLAARYYAATDRFEFRSTTQSLPLPQVFVGVPASAYANVREFRVGTLNTPQFLGPDQRLREWDTQPQRLDLPFSVSVPRDELPGYGAVIFLAAPGRGRVDGRALANDFGGGPRMLFFTVELRCIGNRSVGADGACKDNRTESEVAQLVDMIPNNGNPELLGADGIPDASGRGYFPSDALALRDTQLAAALEVLHFITALRTRGTFEGLPINGAELHLIAQGATAPVGLAVVSMARNLPTNFTLQTPAGGAGYGALILEGPGREDFLAGLPGLNATQAQSYLQELDTTALAPLTAPFLGMRAGARLRIGTRVERALLAHGTGTQYVSSSARMTLREALGLANNRVSGHRANCDNFFLFTCQLGDNPTWREESRRQIVTFITSGGVTVTPPGN